MLAPSVLEVDRLKQQLEESKKRAKKIEEVLQERGCAEVLAKSEKEVAVYVRRWLDEEHATLVKLQEERTTELDSVSFGQSDGIPSLFRFSALEQGGGAEVVKRAIEVPAVVNLLGQTGLASSRLLGSGRRGGVVAGGPPRP
ncbi:uncharacterized protein A4U43_C08F22410 [Asparagus officinalis]|nr:uncharacterized protein A4U43_C08F22410 [Asparagus officinalis]